MWRKRKKIRYAFRPWWEPNLGLAEWHPHVPATTPCVQIQSLLNGKKVLLVIFPKETDRIVYIRSGRLLKKLHFLGSIENECNDGCQTQTTKNCHAHQQRLPMLMMATNMFNVSMIKPKYSFLKLASFNWSVFDQDICHPAAHKTLMT